MLLLQIENRTSINPTTYGNGGLEAANRIAQALAEKGHLAYSQDGHRITIFNSFTLSHFHFQRLLNKVLCYDWVPVINGRNPDNNLTFSLRHKSQIQQTKNSCLPVKVTKSSKMQKITPLAKQVIEKIKQAERMDKMNVD